MTEYQQSQKKAPVFNEDATLRGAWRRVFARAPIVREIEKRAVEQFLVILKMGPDIK